MVALDVGLGEKLHGTEGGIFDPTVFISKFFPGFLMFFFKFYQVFVSGEIDFSIKTKILEANQFFVKFRKISTFRYPKIDVR